MGLTYACRPSLYMDLSPQTQAWPALTCMEGPAASHALVIDSPQGKAYFGLGTGNAFGNVRVYGYGSLVKPECLADVRICTYACACSCPYALGCSCVCYCLYAQLYVGGFTTVGLAYTTVCGYYSAGSGSRKWCIANNCTRWSTSGSGHCCWDSYYYSVSVCCPITCGAVSISICGCCCESSSQGRCCKIPNTRIV